MTPLTATIAIIARVIPQVYVVDVERMEDGKVDLNCVDVERVDNFDVEIVVERKVDANCADVETVVEGKVKVEIVETIED